jgi:hypothetical protein
MAMMTAAIWPSGTAMVARNRWLCKRPRLKNRPRPKKRCGSKERPGVGDYRAVFNALAARISATMVRTAGDSAICLARQAGPGPRI